MAKDPHASSTIKKYKNTDPIYSVMIRLRGGTNLSKSQGEKRVQALIRLLGKPKEKSYETPGDDPGGWYAEWQLSSKRKIEYYSAFNTLHLEFFDAYGYKP